MKHYGTQKRTSTKTAPKMVIERKVGYFQKDLSVTTIYVGNLKYQKDEKEIKEMFSEFGKVAYVRLVLDSKTQKTKGIAFVQMPNKSAALKAINHFNGKEMDGRTLKVSVAQERNEEKLRLQTVGKKSKEEEEITPTKRKRDKGLKVLFNYKKGI